MYIARQKRKENIAEYILYLWQLEDLLRALEFSPEAIYSRLVEPCTGLSAAQQQELFLWYMELADLLRSEGKERQGHLDHTLHLIRDLEELHSRLLTLPEGKEYAAAFAALAPELPTLKERLGDASISDLEALFRALYLAMIHRLDGGDRPDQQQFIADVLEAVSPVVARLAALYRRVEEGEIDLFPEN